MKNTRLYWATTVATTLGMIVACGGDELPAAGGDGDGDTSATGDGDTGDGDTGDGDAATGGMTASGGTTGTGGATSSGGSSFSTGGTTAVTGDTCAIPAALNDYYQPYGWMGDLDAITTSAETDPCEDRAVESPAGDCYKFTVQNDLSNQGWAGIFWQTDQDNWGTAPACDFSGGEAPVVTFWAKGGTGGEEVSFFASDIPEGSLPATTLTDEWTEYTIDLGDSTNLSNLWGAFGFSLGVSADEVVFYVDNITIGGSPGGMGGGTN